MKAQMFNLKKWINTTDSHFLKSKFKEILEKNGFKIVGFVDFHFEPYGYTCLFLLSESHLAIHTFPEENKTYIELSSCVRTQFQNFKQDFVNQFK